jgi:hypothetical protein
VSQQIKVDMYNLEVLNIRIKIITLLKKKASVAQSPTCWGSSLPRACREVFIKKKNEQEKIDNPKLSFFKKSF